MNQQQQRMAAVGTDKELSDLLDFSMVSERGRGALKAPGLCLCAVFWSCRREEM